FLILTDQNSAKLSTKMAAVIDSNNELPLPSVKNTCRNQGIKCPLNQGADYVFAYDLEMKPFFPTLDTTAKLNITGEEGTVFCVTFPIRLVE
ncbi:unnamed protein product, partial [Ixodes hexagonus]